jgi:prepilin-type N-terminal cleavage/methylation domain-containing protein
MSHARRTGGFTLIELLVAITLASLVAVLGAVVLRAALDFHGRANRYLMEGEDLRATDRLLRREWSWRRGQDLVAGVNRLEFQTDRLSSVGDESAARIRYQCSDDEAGQARLERQLLARADAGADSRAGATAAGWRVLRTEVLVPQLVACSFGYLQTRESRDAKIAEWRGEVGPGQPVPRLVRLRLATQRGEIAPLVYEAYGADG